MFKACLLAGIVALSTSIEVNHHLETESEQQHDFSFWNIIKFVKSKSVFSDICTREEERVTTNICSPVKQKCWSWCKDNNNMASNSK